jgi:hypothetical protein
VSRLRETEVSRGQRERARKRQRDMNAFLARATPEEIANHAAHNERYTRNKQLAQAKKDKKKNMTTEERAEFNRQRQLSKAGM